MALSFAAPLAGAFASLRCQLCAREISGVYYTTTDGRIYCDACWSANAICTMCGQLTKSVIKIDGRNFCSNCFTRLEKCSLCGKPLVGNYTQYPNLGLKVCPNCESETARCDKCGVPSKELIKSGRASVCPRCSRQTERCHSCGEALLSEYSFYEGNDAIKYCFDCAKRYPRCDDCGAPSGATGTELDDGRHLCPDCRRVAYFDAGLIGSVKKKVFALVSGTMGLAVERDVAFSIEDRKFLEKKANGIHGDLNGLFYRKGDNYYIYVIYGLREKDIIGVLAHEWAHAWQAENSAEDIPLELQEGFAQWVAYKVLVHFGHEDFARLMTEGDNMYARGLRKIFEIERQSGTVAVYKYARTGKR